MQERIENITSIYWSTHWLTLTDRCDAVPFNNDDRSSKEKVRSDTESDQQQEVDDNIYVLDKIVRHVASGPLLRYVVG